jgi:hypothetical protein
MTRRKKPTSLPQLSLLPSLESNKRTLLDEQAGQELKELIRQINQANAHHRARQASHEDPELPPAA